MNIYGENSVEGFYPMIIESEEKPKFIFLIKMRANTIEQSMNELRNNLQNSQNLEVFM